MILLLNRCILGKYCYVYITQKSKPTYFLRIYHAIGYKIFLIGGTSHSVGFLWRFVLIGLRGVLIEF